MKTDCTPWPKEKEDRLRVLWLQGLSCGQIGKVLGKTRNAICAKVDRMGLPERLNPNQRARTGVRAAKPTQRLPAPKAEADPITPRGAPKNTRNLRFIDRKPNQCAMFCDGEQGANGFVCGEETVAGAWCSHCVRLVYREQTPAEKAMMRRRAA